MSQEITPFKIDVSEAELDDLRRRIVSARWPEAETVDDWRQGVPLAVMQDLCRYWAEDYDWRRCEAALNSLPQFTTEIDGVPIHFIHVRSERDDAIPLILSHGWPGSMLEFLKAIQPLSAPESPDAPAFHVVIPSLPGYGFSGKPTGTGWGVAKIGDAWDTIMCRLGYDRYYAHGGDWGALVTTMIGVANPPGCAAIHLSMPLGYPTETDLANMTDAEAQVIARMDEYWAQDSGYQKVQSSKPQTIGYALADSPVGQAAWIYEKYREWTDNKGKPEDAVSRDELLDVITLYWLTNSGASSGRLYWESATFFRNHNVVVPTGISLFPKEVWRPSRRWCENTFKDLFYWNEPPAGGHFAALEQPSLFVEEIRGFANAMQARAR